MFNDMFTYQDFPQHSQVYVLARRFWSCGNLKNTLLDKKVVYYKAKVMQTPKAEDNSLTTDLGEYQFLSTKDFPLGLNQGLIIPELFWKLTKQNKPLPARWQLDNLFKLIEGKTLQDWIVSSQPEEE